MQQSPIDRVKCVKCGGTFFAQDLRMHQEAAHPELSGTRQAGRYADKVRIEAPQGSRFNGQRGVVVRMVKDTVYVRLDRGGELPFGRGELVVI